MRKGSQTKKSILFLFPALSLIGIFYLYPALMSLFYSFTNKTLVGVKAQNWDFVGLSNYIFMFKDERFLISLLNTVIFLVFSAIIGQQVLGFTIAYLMQRKNRQLRRFVGTTVLLGWVTPEVVVSFVFFAFLNVEGSLNDFIGFFGLKPVAWLYDFPMIAIIIANIWRGTAFSMLMYQSALENVSDSLKEAASIDGANKIQVLFKIILPIIKGTIITNTVLVTLQTIGLFGLIYALTAGGPGFKTTTVPIYMYNKAFVSYQLGYGTAIAIVLLLLGIVLSVFYMKSFKHEL
ncbi:carbohydrate ABC transporter membrane protein 1, CUT1 family (TC 3.A.1.1.-) [Marinitoga hydrogenitolerans DSM 16785]|uniref:Carbohydrate ABC transporter membrane protein 1, CUT1 family (TC 3.A.1.1.-) n=1 Tax=Marinitoga hydrogenitolerans (strain DSM 16785 / JCM 12826 / AT1271) TaxID=1122195 RepID=A0A1M4ZNC7_MARH1|nr:sugar ABC transporter permease [Marinitoga hydrogenitolerans]SHF19076.1 carbohydrate ABC transporter membrane protein 1, CUT1 family (TC 3.A.1.1.-) [Marinitoga hydrogenitolerans DSM 16785]